MLEIEAADIRPRAKQVLEYRVAQVAIYRSAAEAENGIASAKLTGHPPDEVVAERLHRRRRFHVCRIQNPRILLGGDCVKESNAPCADLASQLPRADDRCRIRHVHELSVGKPRR